MASVQCSIICPLVTDTRKTILGNAKLEFVYETIWWKIGVVEGIGYYS